MAPRRQGAALPEGPLRRPSERRPVDLTPEELNQANEEIRTMNEQLADKVHELLVVNDDLANLIESTDVATVFLDTQLRIKRFTATAARPFNLTASDVGRPIAHIASNLLYENLIQDIEGVLRSLAFVQKEVQTKDGHWFRMKIMPYRTSDNVIDGVVLTFVDIDDQKKFLLAVESALDFVQGIVNTVREPLMILDKDLRVVFASESFYHTFRVIKEETERKLIYELGDGQWDIPALRQLLHDIIPNKAYFNDFKVEYEFEKIGRKTMLLNARLIDFAGHRENLILLAMEDVSGRNSV